MKKNLIKDLKGRSEFKKVKRSYFGTNQDFARDLVKQPSSVWAWAFIDEGGTFNLPTWGSVGIEPDCALALEEKGVSPNIVAEYVRTCGEVVWVPVHHIKKYKSVPETLEELAFMLESWWYQTLKRA